MNLCIRVWDNILVEGSVFMFKFPLAIMAIFEKAMLEMDLEQINDLFESLNSESELANTSISYDPEYIISKARGIKISSEEIDELKKKYQEEMEVGREKVIREIPIIDEQLVDDQFFRRPSEGLHRFLPVTRPSDDKVEEQKEIEGERDEELKWENSPNLIFPEVTHQSKELDSILEKHNESDSAEKP